MPNLEDLVDRVAEQIDEQEGEARYTSVYMLYAYGQMPLDEETAKQFSFQVKGVKATGSTLS